MRTNCASRFAFFAVLGTAAALTFGACSSSAETSSSSNSAPSTSSSGMNEAPATNARAKGIVDIAASNPDFSTLVTAVKAAGLDSTLSGSGPFTVFAPTNEALAKLPAATLQNLLKPENKQQLADILKYHVVPGKVMAADVKPGMVETVNGADLTLSNENGTVYVTDAQGNKAKVVKADVTGSNGVIHVIDTVLLPPTN